jgi:hypothetical protein
MKGTILLKTKGQTDSYANIYTGLPTALNNVLVNNPCQIITEVYLLFYEMNFCIPFCMPLYFLLSVKVSQAIRVGLNIQHTKWLTPQKYILRVPFLNHYKNPLESSSISRFNTNKASFSSAHYIEVSDTLDACLYAVRNTVQKSAVTGHPTRITEAPSRAGFIYLRQNIRLIKISLY